MKTDLREICFPVDQRSLFTRCLPTNYFVLHGAARPSFMLTTKTLIFKNNFSVLYGNYQQQTPKLRASLKAIQKKGFRFYIQQQQKSLFKGLWVQNIKKNKIKMTLA